MGKLGIILLILGILLLFAYLLYASFFSARHVAKIIHKNKEHYSIILAENDRVLINIHPEKDRPLASVVKLIVAIEFAEQVAGQRLTNDEPVPLSDLQKYHVPDTDGNAQVEWLSYLEREQKLIDGDKVPLWEVARGMIAFSSNANTEYLMDKLGIDKVNDRLRQLGIKKHSPIHYLVADLYLTENELKNDTDQELFDKCVAIHEKLKTGAILTDSFDYGGLTLRKQKALNDRMTASTAREYYELLKKIRSNDYCNEQVQTELNRLIERKSQPGKYDIVRYGGKGGSTLWVLNNAAYLERKNGKRYEFVLFSDYPTEANDNFLISKMMGKLISEIANDTKAARKLIDIINK